MKKRKDGRYSTTVTIGYDQRGKRKQVVLYGKTKAELEMKKAQLLIDKDHRTLVKDKSVSFGQYANQWLKRKKTQVTDTYMYESVFRNYLDQLSSLPLIDVTFQDCQSIIDEASGKPRTCQKIKITLDQIFKSALKEQLIYRNPVDGLLLPKYKSKPKRALSDDEKIILDNCPFRPRERMYVDLLRFYGLRKEEALALKKSDFDFDRQILKIEHACKFVNNKPTEKETKTGKCRYLMIFPDHIDQFMAFVLSCDDSDPHIFRNLRGGSWITEQSFRRMFDTILATMQKTAENLGLEFSEDLTSHIFRHGFATDLYYAGVGLKDAQYLLGHSTARVTMDIYTHLDEMHTDVRDKLVSYHRKTGA